MWSSNFLAPSTCLDTKLTFVLGEGRLSAASCGLPLSQWAAATTHFGSQVEKVKQVNIGYA